MPITRGYARASLLKQERSPDQQIELMDARMERGDLPGPLVVRTEHASAIHKRWHQRQEFRKLCDEIQPGDVLLVWRLDRIDRIGFPLVGAIDYLKDRGVRIISLEDRAGRELDLDTALGRAMVHMQAISSDIWSETHARTAKENHAYRRKHKFADGRYRIGMRRDIINGQQVDVWDDHEIEQVREIIRRHQAGETFTAIAKDFHVREERTSNNKRWVRFIRNGSNGYGPSTRRIRSAWHYWKLLRANNLDLGDEAAKELFPPIDAGNGPKGEPKPKEPKRRKRRKKTPVVRKPKKEKPVVRYWYVQWNRIEFRATGRVDHKGVLHWVDRKGLRGRAVPGKYRSADRLAEIDSIPG